MHSTFNLEVIAASKFNTLGLRLYSKRNDDQKEI
jgi:hypothetical protein